MRLDLQGHFGDGFMEEMHREAVACYGLAPRGTYDSWADNHLDLSDEQAVRASQVINAVCKRNWELRGRVREAQARLGRLLEHQVPDPDAVGVAYAALYKLHQQVLETHLQAHKDIDGLLTPEQREKARRLRALSEEVEQGSQGYRRGLTPR